MVARMDCPPTAVHGGWPAFATVDVLMAFAAAWATGRGLTLAGAAVRVSR
ncbi:MAG: hypothetical protein U0232_29825 [Thermomicrobiales bacterium]